ncbi:MAG: polysaccharide biosynthesis protein, partial [Acidobacteria bacterium]|nr:polysaccharide biosynthesis protein [Acidobacteriota bacterium]
MRLLKDLEESAEWRVVGLLDYDSTKRRGAIRGVEVLGPIGDAAKVAGRFGAADAVIAMPSVSREARRRAVEICTAAGLKVKTVPAHEDIVSGRVSISVLRAVELDDLLGREAVQLDEAGLAGMIKGRRVLITGAGGSIGAELCRQIARFGPEQLVLLELSEHALYSIEQDLADRLPGVPVAAVIGDAKSVVRVG